MPPEANSSAPQRCRLLISCPDRPGIVAAVTQFLYERGANVVHSDQHSTSLDDGLFFMRLVFDMPGPESAVDTLEQEFADIGRQFSMEWRVERAARQKRLAIFVSKQDHCLLELLWQRRAGDLQATIAMVVSNHPDLRSSAESWDIPFYYVPVPTHSRHEAEREQLEILNSRADVVVLARYMQILSPEFLARWAGRIINIHHSFLPAFVGARPYDQAYERGVKLIGATAHYVTEELDAGPIIEQGVERVDHRHGPDQLRRIGRHVEREVLARAVRWHVEDRVLVHGNKTVVFS